MDVFVCNKASKIGPAATIMGIFRFGASVAMFAAFAWVMTFCLIFLLMSLLALFVLIMTVGLFGEKGSQFVKNTESMLFSTLWSSVVSFIFVYVVLGGLVKYIFTDPGGSNSPIVSRNKNFFDVVAFIASIFSLIVALFLGAIRIISSIFFAMVYLSRIDQCLLPRKYFKYDHGYRAYIAFCHMDHATSHPVLCSFCRLLANSSSKYTPSLARKKWWLFVTLSQNPGLILQRKKRLTAMQKRIMDKGDKDDIDLSMSITEDMDDKFLVKAEEHSV